MTDPYTRNVYATGMQTGARVCKADHDQMLAAAAEQASWRTALAVLMLAMVAVWLRGRAS